MGRTRRKRDLKREALSREALRPLLGAVAAICVTLTAALVLTSRTRQTDLFDLTPREPVADGHELLAWRALERGHGALKKGAVATGARVRALGYMTHGVQHVRNGQAVHRFIIVPELDHGDHPAPRFGDQMIEVRLPDSESVTFREGQLLWVSGTLVILPGSPHGDKPLYRVSDARTQSAGHADIPKYFH